MAWEWSHTQEAYALAEKNLHRKSLKWLAECYAEWKCYDIDAATTDFNEALYCLELKHEYVECPLMPQCLITDPMLDGRYTCIFKEARTFRKELLADYIWKRASQQRTCANGGGHPHMCPHGCHTVEW